jgi:sarcosine oxidase gamma subunit
MLVFLHEAHDQPRQMRLGLQVLRLHPSHDRKQLIHVAVGDVEQDVFLVLVIVVEQRLRHPAGFGQLGHRRVVKTLVGKEPRRLLKDDAALYLECGRFAPGHCSLPFLCK